MHINWYPGHMAKAHRMIREHLKLVDVVIELLDARIPYSSSNPIISQVVEGKPHVIALNKADLAEPLILSLWIKHFRGLGFPVVALEAVSGKGAKELVTAVEREAQAKLAKLAAKGINPRAVRAMILGIPNVGKSSLINRLLGTSTVKTADKPGVTRGKQWIKIGKDLELLDTPGVLWPKLEDQNVAVNLAMTGAINDEVYDFEEVLHKLLFLLRNQYPDRLIERYDLIAPLPEETMDLLALIATRRGCLRSGGQIDFEKAGKIVVNEFRAGILGKFTIESPRTKKNNAEVIE